MAVVMAGLLRERGAGNAAQALDFSKWITDH